MTHLTRLLLTIFIIFFSIAAGYILKRSASSGRLRIDPAVLGKWRSRAQSAAIFILFPAAAALSLWGMPRPKPDLLLLPPLGVLTYTAGGAMALLLARPLNLARTQAGAFYCCGAFNNIGAVGSLVCLIFLGESSIALAALFRVFEEIYYFGLSFPIARRFADHGAGKVPAGKSFFWMLLLIVCALLAGVALNVLGIPRPAACGPLASIFVLAGTVIFLITIGLSLRLSSARDYAGPALAMCLIKFCLLPLIVTGAAYFLDLGSYAGGLALKVCLVLSAMPVAMTALAPAALFGLDLDLANACWIVTTLALLAVLPLLYYILPYI